MHTIELAVMDDYSWTAVALDDARRATIKRRARLRDDFAGMVAASADSNADDEHDPEGATIAFERAQISALIKQAESHLVEIESAQGRVEDGSFGLCETCGERIAFARLQARPVARTCITCA